MSPSANPFAQRVADALANVPHDATCRFSVGPQFPHHCDCTREARIAAQLAEEQRERIAAQQEVARLKAQIAEHRCGLPSSIIDALKSETPENEKLKRLLVIASNAGIQVQRWHDALAIERDALAAQVAALAGDSDRLRDENARLQGIYNTAVGWYEKYLAQGERVTQIEADNEVRMTYLFWALPFSIRHQWGGDVAEFIEGIDAAVRAAALLAVGTPVPGPRTAPDLERKP